MEGCFVHSWATFFIFFSLPDGCGWVSSLDFQSTSRIWAEIRIVFTIAISLHFSTGVVLYECWRRSVKLIRFIPHSFKFFLRFFIHIRVYTISCQFLILAPPFLIEVFGGSRLRKILFLFDGYVFSPIHYWEVYCLVIYLSVIWGWIFPPKFFENVIFRKLRRKICCGVFLRSGRLSLRLRAMFCFRGLWNQRGGRFKGFSPFLRGT